MPSNESNAAARAFLRGLNLLLKSVRLYGFDHQRTTAQVNAVWDSLQGVWPPGAPGDLTIGVAGGTLLVNGERLEASASERSLAQLLIAAALSSVQISSRVSREEFTQFIQIFAKGSARPTELAEQLHAAIGPSDAAPIRINELKFVAREAGAPDDEPTAGTSVTGAMIAGALPGDPTQLQEWLNDPVKLLQLIAAAGAAPAVSTGSAASSAEVGLAPTGAISPRTTEAPPATPTLDRPLQEDELFRLLHLLTNLGQAGSARGPAGAPQNFEQQLTRLPAPAQVSLRQALAHMAEAPPQAKPQTPVLLQLAEQLAIRFALERFQRGDARVDTVQQMIERMGHELDSLRKVLRSHEDQMGRAGLQVESHAEILDREFWARIPASGKRSVLLAPEAWCIPPRNVRQFVLEVKSAGDRVAAEILANFAACVRGGESEARRKAAAGILALADLYAADPALLATALAEVGGQFSEENEPELQSQLQETFLRLGQEAMMRREYAAMVQTLDLLASLERRHPARVPGLRQRLGFEKHLPELIEEALRAPQIPGGLAEFLQAVPEIAAEQLSSRLIRCARKRERERVVDLAREAGSSCIAQLRDMLATRPISEGVGVVGLFSRLDPQALAELLSHRLRDAGRAIDDAVLRQLLIAAPPERGRLLAELLELFDPLVIPRAIEEIALSADPATAPRLLRLAEGRPPADGRPYLRVKAIEALGQLPDPSAAPVLRSLVEARRVLGWTQPEELRLVAAQALLRIDPAWAKDFLPRSGLHPSELAWGPLEQVSEEAAVRQRYYRRVRVTRSLNAVLVSGERKSPVTIKILGLGGGLATCFGPVLPVVEAELKLHSGLRPISARVVARSLGAQQAVFEIVDIELEERTKLRRLLLALAGTVAPAPRFAHARGSRQPDPPATRKTD